mgnify:CR=1 FL=1|jgi:hypothetical protein
MYKYKKTSYLVKDIPVELWKRCRSRCMEDGNKVNDVMIHLITKFVEDTKFAKFQRSAIKKTMTDCIGYRGEE